MTTVFPANSASWSSVEREAPPPTSADRSGASSHERLPARRDIQGLRAVAVLLVILFHAGVPGLDGGYVGVDVFFVISGFLITGQLRRLNGAGIAGQLSTFYARRILRLLPVAGVVILATVVAAKLVVPPLTMPDVASTGRASGLYFVNVLFALQNTAYLSNTAPSPFQHYWSLAVEEQFYLFWPLALLAITALCARRQRRVIAVVGVGVVLSLAGAVYLTAKVQPYAFFLLPTRAWEFGIGALLTLAPHMVRRLPRLASTCISWAGLAAIVAAGVLFDDRTPFPSAWALVPALGAAAVIATGADRRGAGRLLAIGPAVWIGGISYSLYLWHWPLLIVPVYGRGTSLGVIETVVLVAVTVGLAIVSERWIERPFRSSVWWRAKRRRAYGLGLAITVVTVAVTTALGATGPLSVGTTLAEWPATADTADAPAPSAVGRNLTPTLAAAAADQPRMPATCIADYLVTAPVTCSFGDQRATRTILLLGDSHAQQWLPALDLVGKDDGYKVVTLLKVSCPVLPVAVFNDRLGRPYSECDTWRAAALATVDRLRPATVVIGHYDGEEFVDAGADRGAVWAAGMTSLLASLPPASRPIVLGDNPAWAAPPSNCLSAHLRDASACSAPLDVAVDQAQRKGELAAARSAGAVVLDTADLLCPRGTCPTILWNVLIYRDVNHVTATLAARFAPAFSSAVQRASTTA